MVKLTIGTIINTAMVKVHWVLLPNLSLNLLKQLSPSCANDFLMRLYMSKFCALISFETQEITNITLTRLKVSFSFFFKFTKIVIVYKLSAFLAC